MVKFQTTNARQFQVEILGLRKPGVGEVFEIEVPPYRQRVEVECVERSGSHALVERTDDGPAISGVRSRVISDRKETPPDLRYGVRAHPHITSREVLRDQIAETNYEEFLHDRDQDEARDVFYDDLYMDSVEDLPDPDPEEDFDPSHTGRVG